MVTNKAFKQKVDLTAFGSKPFNFIKYGAEFLGKILILKN